MSESHVEPGTNLLVLSPPFEDQTGPICSRLLAGDDPDDRHVLCVSFTHPLDQWIEDWAAAIDSEPASWTFVKMSDTHTDPVPADLGIDLAVDDVRTVPNPGDVTGLALAFTKYRDGIENPAQISLCVHSLTPMLQYVPLETAYRFLNWLTDQVRSDEATAHCHIDPSAHDERTISRLSTLFDDRLEVAPVGERGSVSES